MSVISKETAYRIYSAWCEIEATRKLREELAGMTHTHDPKYPRDAFGNVITGFEFGVPMDITSKRLYRVSNKLAPAILTAHEAQMEADLVAASQAALLEMQNGGTE